MDIILRGQPCALPHYVKTSCNKKSKSGINARSPRLRTHIGSQAFPLDTTKPGVTDVYLFIVFCRDPVTARTLSVAFPVHAVRQPWGFSEICYRKANVAERNSPWNSLGASHTHTMFGYPIMELTPNVTVTKIWKLLFLFLVPAGIITTLIIIN